MLKNKKKQESVSSPQKESKPLNKVKETGPAGGENPANNIKRDASANLFEDHIREEKKEGI